MEENQLSTQTSSDASPNKARSVFQKILDEKLAELKKKLEKKHEKQKKRTDATITFLKAEIEKAKKKVNDPELLKQKIKANARQLSATSQIAQVIKKSVTRVFQILRQSDASFEVLKRCIQHQSTKTKIICISKAFSRLLKNSALLKVKQVPKLNLSRLTSTGGLEEQSKMSSQASTSAIPPPPSSNTQSSAIPQIGGSAIPAIPSPGGSAIPPVGGSAIPSIPSGSSAIPAIGGSAIPSIGGSAIPAIGGSAIPSIPQPGGSAIPAMGGSAIPVLPPPPGGSAIPVIGSSISPGGLLAPPPPPGLGGLIPPPPPGAGGLIPPPLPGMGGPQSGGGMLRNIFEKEMKPTEGLVPKRLQWIVISQNQVKDTFWLQTLPKAKVQLDYKELEALFCGQQESPVKKPEKSKDEELTPRKPKEMILDTKKIQDTAIQLKNFSYSHQETKEIFQNFDTEKMTPDFVQKVKRVIPSAEEIEKLKTFKGNPENLQKEEQFLLMLIKIPRNKQILRCLEERENFSFLEDSALKDINLMIKAGSALLENKNFDHILIIVLKIGNFLNYGTNKGRAIGFKLDFLSKIVDIQSASKVKKMSLFHFIVKTVRTKNKELLNFIQELAILQIARNTDISIAEDKIKEIERLITFVKKEIEFQSAIQHKTPLNQRFLEEFGKFYEVGDESLHSLQLKWDEMKELETKLNKKYGERNDSSLQQMMQKIGEFTKRFETQLVDMIQREEREDRDKIKKEARNPKIRRQTSMAPAIQRSLRFCVSVKQKTSKDDIQMRMQSQPSSDSSSEDSDNNETGTSLKATRLLLTKLSLRDTPQDARFKKKISQPALYKT